MLDKADRFVSVIHFCFVHQQTLLNKFKTAGDCVKLNKV